MEKIPLIAMLENNKGTISSALSKKLAKEVLEGNTDILAEALELVAYDPKNKKSKNIRAGAQGNTKY